MSFTRGNSHANSRRWFIFPPPPLWNFCPTEDTNFSTKTLIRIYATYSGVSQKKVVETKSRQTLAFDPGGCSSHLRDRPFLGGRHALLRGGGGCLGRRMVFEAGKFFVELRTSTSFQEKAKRFCTPCVYVRLLLPQRQTSTRSGDSTRLWKLRGMNGWQGTPRSEELCGKYDLE